MQLDHSEYGSEESQYCVERTFPCTTEYLASDSIQVHHQDAASSTPLFPSGDAARFHELQLEPDVVNYMELEDDVRSGEEEAGNYQQSSDEKGANEEQPTEKPPGGSDEGGNQLQDRPSRPSFRQRSIAIILLLTGSGLITAVIVFHSPPRPLRRFIRKHVDPKRFRVGEALLLRWADEDMEMIDGEEDVMVNGGDDLIDDESIPLKPSPRKNPLVYYGSAQR
ncbi:hypothetical protein HYDPIDRAFT_28903 [Hydnomerulius pinastri MD-312]|uniref:Uncharacterized protein n=1 Tax=Hydnomerulius pinastri MD-312 TaxID=994086 RepID=A0A0C9VEL9_9AGAM|nr:hypothetical protein HYDPIDRAFT_28903 [Hydnomerulius pinastri MD-312]